ncbi:LysE family translocator [Corynebacterium casei]|uniref:LysE family translocator n=1 Tax=Corynebacterium casei TaxID=160386 RepID=UPI003FD41510
MTFASLLTLIGVWFAVCIAPGPDVVQVMRVASRSVRAGLWCAAGITAGIAVWLTASLAGMSALIAARTSLLGILQLFGGAFLIWMGIQSVRSGFSARRAPSRVVGTENSAPTAEPPEAAAAAPTKLPVLTAGRSFRLGLYTNLSNPKALVFFGAVFAQFIRPRNIDCLDLCRRNHPAGHIGYLVCHRHAHRADIFHMAGQILAVD